MKRGIAIGSLVALAGLATPGAAQAYLVDVTPDGALTFEGSTLAGVSFDGPGSRYIVHEYNISLSTTDGTCTNDVTYPMEIVYCPSGLVNRIDASSVNQIQLDDSGPDAIQIPSTLRLLGSFVQAYGGAGDDVITSSVANSADTITGGPGNDTLRAGPSLGFTNPDQIDGGEGNDVLDGGIGVDTIDGGPGTDTLDYTGRSDALTVGLPEGSSIKVGNGGSADGPGSKDTISEIENVTGGSGADSLTGNSLANMLAGGTGGDRLSGASGVDTLLGGLGADRLTGGVGADALLGQGGVDVLFARDGIHDKSINCGPGKNRRERATRDRKDPPAKSC